MAFTLFASSKETPDQAAVPRGRSLLLGAALLLAGLVVLGDVVLATIVSTVLLGACAVAAGLFEIVHGFWTKGWGGLIWHVLLGCLSIAGGIALMTAPVAGSLILTFVLGFVLAASGIVRVVVGLRNLTSAGGVLLLSGAFGLLAGIMILAQWPSGGLSIIGTLLGLDLALHGAGWLALALTARSPR